MKQLLRLSSILLICSLWLDLSGPLYAQFDFATLKDDQLQVKSLDFAFDGGSLLFEVESKKTGPFFLLIAHPSSALIDKNSKTPPVLLSKSKRMDRSNAKFLTAVEIDVLVAGLMHGSDVSSPIQSSTTATFLAVSTGRPVLKWGPDAVQEIELGHWIPLFVKNRD